MRIVHVVDFFSTDLRYQEFHLALQHGRAGHEVHVVTTDRRHGGLPAPTAAAEAGARLLADAGVQVHALPARDLGHDRVWITGLPALLDELGPDAVHCHHSFSPTTLQIARWASRRRVALLCDSHLSALNSPGAEGRAGRVFYGTWRTVAGPWLRRRVGAFVVNGSPEAAFLADHLALPADRVEVIPLGFDPAEFTFDPGRRAAARARWGCDDADTVVAVTGKLTLDRSPERSLDAAERLAADRSVRVLVAGSVGDGVRDRWAEAAPVLTAGDRIHELGFVDPAGLADCYLAADVATFPFGSTISAYEALGTGLPVAVVDGDFGSFLEALDVGATAVDFATIDLSALLVDEHARRDRAAAAARELGWPVLADRFVDRYRAIAPPAAPLPA